MSSLDVRASGDGRHARTLSGTGLHSGVACSVTLIRSPGPVRFVTDYGEASLEELEVIRVDRGVQVAAPRVGFELDLVEHLLAALGGLGIRQGVAIEARGPELPLLDGAANEWATALVELCCLAEHPTLRIARRARLEVSSSIYYFEPGDRISVEVAVEFDGIGKQRAHWDGSVEGFLRDIAPARTFGFRSDWPRLRAAGRARAVDPRAVMVLDETGHVEPPGAPAGPDELARHKLLDLLGDFYLYGGPPVGTVRAFRPGHAATHTVMRRAIVDGIVHRRPGC